MPVGRKRGDQYSTIKCNVRARLDYVSRCRSTLYLLPSEPPSRATPAAPDWCTIYIYVFYRFVGIHRAAPPEPLGDRELLRIQQDPQEARPLDRLRHQGEGNEQQPAPACRRALSPPSLHGIFTFPTTVVVCFGPCRPVGRCALVGWSCLCSSLSIWFVDVKPFLYYLGQGARSQSCIPVLQCNPPPPGRTSWSNSRGRETI